MASDTADRVSSLLQRLVVLLLVVLVLVAGWTFLHSGKSVADPKPSTSSQAALVDESALPTAARATIRRIDAGGPFPNANDGAVFPNDDHALPTQPQGFYHRYAVSGSSAIVQGQDDSLFYTTNGYRTFTQVKR